MIELISKYINDNIYTVGVLILNTDNMYTDRSDTIDDTNETDYIIIINDASPPSTNLVAIKFLNVG